MHETLVSHLTRAWATPSPGALPGGPGDRMISDFIAFYTNQAVNWRMAAVATILIILPTLMLSTLESPRRRNERLRGIKPA